MGRTPGGGERGSLTLVQDSVGRLVPGQGLLGQVLVALSKALHLCQASVERHGWVVGILGHVEVRSPPELFLDHQCLLQQLGGEGTALAWPPSSHQHPPKLRLWAGLLLPS